MKRCQKVHSFRGKRGAFTLVEIMVAAAITVIMVGLVIQITGEVLKIWNRSAGKLSASAEARITMELITSDLESAVFRNDGMSWLLAVDDGDAALRVANYDPPTIKLILFTPAQDRPELDASGNPVPGNICAVEYTLVYQDPVSGNPDPDDNTYALHRRLIDPVTTFESLLGQGNQETFPWADQQWPVSPNISLASLEGGNYPPPENSDYYLSGNVVDFSVDFFCVGVDASGDEVLRQVPPTDPGVVYGGTNATVGPQATDTDYRYPIEYADISITVISDEGMEILRNLGENRGGTGFQSGEGKKVVRQYGETYKRRVYFQAKPL